jgi:hypothetical protein
LFKKQRDGKSMKKIMVINLRNTQLEGYNPELTRPTFQGGRVVTFNCDGLGNALIQTHNDQATMSTMTWDELETLLRSGWYDIELPNDRNWPNVNERFHFFISPNQPYNLDNDMELENLNNSPILKYLLFQYIGAEYEENADYSEDSLWAEYLLLKRNGQLNRLFVQEVLYNYRPNN